MAFKEVMADFRPISKLLPASVEIQSTGSCSPENNERHGVDNNGLHSSSPPAPSAEVVGNAFVEQYDHILHHSPEVQEIKTCDAQKSRKEGVTVLVTGCLIGRDKLGRKFAQSFFLALQDNGYFVLNDVVRYVELTEPLEIHSVNGVDKVPKTSETDPINSHVVEEPLEIHSVNGVNKVPKTSETDPINSHVVEGKNVVENADKLSDHERPLTNENESIVESHSHPFGTEVSETPELSSSSLEDDPKKSHASIVRVTKGRSGPTRVYVPINTVKVAPKKTESLSVESVNNVMPETSLVNVEMPKRNNNHEEVEGFSIYIRNLPLQVTVAQLEAEFKNLDLSSKMASKLEIARKISSYFGSNNIGRGRIFSGSGGYRTDNFRPRRAGNYGGGAISGYIRQEYGHSV